MFETASIAVENGQTFTVTAKNVSRENIFIQSASLNGRDFNRTYLTHKEIMQGGDIEFLMSDKPNQRWGANINMDTPPDLGIGEFKHAGELPTGSR